MTKPTWQSTLMEHVGPLKGLMDGLFPLVDVFETPKSKFLEDASTTMFLLVEKEPANRKSYWVNCGFSGIPRWFSILDKVRWTCVFGKMVTAIKLMDLSKALRSLFLFVPPAPLAMQLHSILTIVWKLKKWMTLMWENEDRHVSQAWTWPGCVCSNPWVLSPCFDGNLWLWLSFFCFWFRTPESLQFDFTEYCTLFP